MILHVFWFALAAVPTVVGQVATCTTGNFAWASNSLGQDPCAVAEILTQPCPPGYVFGPLSPGQLYTPSQANNCTCNTVRYSLISVCAACQGGSWLPFSNYTQACTSRFLQVYPETIPSNTNIPGWAYLPLSSTDTFDINAASKDAESVSTALPSTTSTSSSQVASTSSSSSSSQRSASSSTSSSSTSSSSTPSSSSSSSNSSSSTSSSSSSPRTAKTDTGAIAGGTVAGVLGGALIGGLLFWIYTRRKAAGRDVKIWVGREILASPTLRGSPASAQLLYQGQKLYNPDDPTTYPPTRDQLTEMNLLPTRTIDSTGQPYFPGRPEL